MFAIKREQQIGNFVPGLAIEVAGGLIGEQNGRAPVKGPGQRHPLLLSYMYSQKDAGLYGYSMAIGVVIFLFSFALSACVNKVTNRDTLEF